MPWSRPRRACPCPTGIADIWSIEETGTNTTHFITGEIVLDRVVFAYPDRSGIPEYVPVLRH
jgi:hypothetical protein